MTSVEDLKAILKNGKASGENLYDHLKDTLLKILVDKPPNVYDQFEAISSSIKVNPYKLSKLQGEVDKLVDVEQSKLLKKYIKELREHYQVIDEPVSEIVCQNISDDLYLLRWSNIGFTDQDAYILNIAMKKLAESLPPEVSTLRFFGIVQTRSHPYYIIEGLSPDEEESADPAVREGKEGVNKYSYWVSNRLTGKPNEWIKLPPVTYEQIIISRQSKRILTGSLTATLSSYPPFPGNENHYLRALIADIHGSTSISPEGYYELDEDADDGSIKKVESGVLAEKSIKSSVELKEHSSWRHHELIINSIGRITPIPEPEEGEESAESPELVEVYKPLSELNATDWSMRAFQYESNTVVARSNLWPGAVAVTNGKKFVNIYVGNGLKYEPQRLNPPVPSPLQPEVDILSAETIGIRIQADVVEDPSPPVEEGENKEGGEGGEEGGDEDS